MKRLILMRHAKSDWSDGAADIDRKLNARGRRSATAVGNWLRAEGISPDEVLCSSAARTQETLKLLKLSNGPATTLTRNLYLAEPDAMVALLRGASGNTVLMLGHNPGSALVARMLIAEQHPDGNLARFPTCATLVLDFEIDEWADLSEGTGQPVHFIVPRQLTD